MRWQHCLDHADNIQKPAKSPDYLLGIATQPSDSRLIETVSHVEPAVVGPLKAYAELRG